jgi:hypothetical protein
LSPTDPAPDRKSNPEVDFDLDDLDADEEKYLDFYRKVAVHEDMLVPLAEHHDGPHSFCGQFPRVAALLTTLPARRARGRDYRPRHPSVRRLGRSSYRPRLVPAVERPTALLP